MAALMTALTLWTILLAADVSVQARESVEVELFRRVLSEFDTAQQAAIDAARQAKTDKDREAANRLIPDPRRFAQRFLDLARDAKDEATIVDALVWVIRHPGRGSGGKTPESDEAVRQIGERFIRSDRITGICWPIAAKGESGERILRRIVEENANPGVRGQACLGLAFAHRMMLREVRRYKTTPAERRNEWVKAYGKDRIDRLEKSDPAVLISESERWLERMLGEYPSAVLNPEVSDFFPLLSEDLGRGAETTLRRAAEGHPDAKTRQEAACALLVQQMKLAPLVAGAAGEDAGVQFTRSVEDVPGGATRVKSIDPRLLAPEIDRRLRGIADHADVRPQSGTSELAQAGLNLYHLLTALGSNQGFHVGADRLLRRFAEGHPDGRVRSLARRSLVLHLAGVAEASARLRFAAGADLAYWVDLLGEERIGQIRRMDPDQLNREARVLADQVAAESREVRGTPDRDIEGLRQKLGRTAVGSVAPEIEGADLEGKPFKLSDYRGRVVLLDFWNHRTCPHCREAYPKLRALARGLEGRPFTLLGVDSDDDRADLARLVNDGTVTWRFWFTHGTVEEPTFLRWNIQGVPNVVVLDHRGVIRVRYVGTPELESLEKVVNDLVKEAEGTGGSGD